MTDEKTQPKATVASWKKAAFHEPMLPSGFRPKIKIPDLPALIEAGQIPQHLLEAALGVARAALEDKVPSVEELTQNAIEEREFTDLMVLMSVIEPKLTEADVRDIPVEDKQFLVSLATRQRDLDMEGEPLGDLMKSEKYRRFRGVGEFDPTLEGA